MMTLIFLGFLAWKVPTFRVLCKFSQNLMKATRRHPIEANLNLYMSLHDPCVYISWGNALS